MTRLRKMMLEELSVVTTLPSRTAKRLICSAFGPRDSSQHSADESNVETRSCVPFLHL